MDGFDREAVRQGFATVREISRVVLERQRREEARRSTVSSAAELVAFFMEERGSGRETPRDTRR
jgi:hypothetical protein